MTEHPGTFRSPARRARVAILLVMAGTIPVVFDPHTGDVFNLPKYSLLAAGGLILTATWAVQWAHEGRPPRMRTGMSLIIACLAAWTLVAAVAGVDTRVSLLGAYGSYGGLYSVLALATVAIAAATSLTTAQDVSLVLATLALGGGGIVALYGLLQVHDRVLGGTPWDPVAWPSLPFTNVFSTLGNPNHLAGFVAIILPTVVVLAVARPSTRLPPNLHPKTLRRPATQRPSVLWPVTTRRIAALVVGAAMVVDLAQSGSRGGWVAALAGIGVTAICIMPELRRRPIIALVVALSVLGSGVVAVFVYGSRFLGSKSHRLFATGGSSSIHQHLLLWGAGLRISASHLLAGTGPDTFSLVFPRYETAQWARLVGPQLVANGSHNLFVDALAGEGLVGLALLLALMVTTTALALRTWKRLQPGGPRYAWRQSSDGPPGTHRSGDTAAAPAIEIRLLLGAVAGGLTAFAIQAMFDTKQVALSFCFWLLIGLLGALASAAQVGEEGTSRSIPHRLARVARSALPKTLAGRNERAQLHRSRLQAPRNPSRGKEQHMFTTLLVGLAASVAVAVLGFGAFRPYRADHDYWAWEKQEAVAARDQARMDRTAEQDAAVRVLVLSNRAISLNPWEPLYPGTIGTDLAVEATGMRSGSTGQVQAFLQADYYLQRAISDTPLAAHWRFVQAQVLVDLSRLIASSADDYRRAAAADLHLAVLNDPRNPVYASYLRTALPGER